MKKLLTIALLFPVLLFAQQKDGGFIKKFLYLKATAAALLPLDASGVLPAEDNAAAIFGTIGGKIGRYAAVGFSAGYSKLREAGSINPVGVDITITDFNRKTACPVFVGQWYHAPFTEYYSRGGYLIVSHDITGKDMFHVAGGVALPALKTKMLITMGVTRLRSKTEVTENYGPNPPVSSISNTHQNMIDFAVSLVF